MELPSLQALQRQLPGGTELVTVAVDEDPELVRQYVREHQIEYPVLLGTPETVRAFGVRAFPTNYYLDGRGRVHAVTVGMSSRLAMWLRLWWLHLRA